MHARDQLRPVTIAIIVLLEKLSSFLVECGVRIGVDEETFDGDEDVTDAVRRLPVLFEGVDTDFALVGHVGMEDFRSEPAWKGQNMMSAQCGDVAYLEWGKDVGG